MHSLRSRLVISHILPLIVTVPLVGVALVYILETQVLLSSLTGELQNQAALIAEITAQRVDIWYDPVSAQALVTRIGPRLNSQVMLLKPGGDILASSSTSGSDKAGQILQPPGMEQALGGETSMQVYYEGTLHTEVAEILMPVIGQDNKVVGVVRVTNQIANLQDRFTRTRSLIIWVLGIGLLLGGLVGSLLAYSLERPLAKATKAILQLSSIDQAQPIPAGGPKELRLLVQAFNSLLERLRTMEESRRRLLANLVHEIARPLGAMRSAIQALQRGASDDSVLRNELLSGIDGEVSRLHRMVEDLARLHSQAQGGHEMNKKPTHLATWLPPIIATWRETAQAKGINWQTEIAPDIPVIEIDPDRMGQALGNLLSNATQYTPAGGTISINANYNWQKIWICVHNSGPVISDGEQEKIFAPFFRGQHGRRFPQGMGLGLTIANDLVEAHGGSLTLESNPDHGNTFTISLPFKDASLSSENYPHQDITL